MAGASTKQRPVERAGSTRRRSSPDYRLLRLILFPHLLFDLASQRVERLGAESLDDAATGVESGESEAAVQRIELVGASAPGHYWLNGNTGHVRPCLPGEGFDFLCVCRHRSISSVGFFQLRLHAIHRDKKSPPSEAACRASSLSKRRGRDSNPQPPDRQSESKK